MKNETFTPANAVLLHQQGSIPKEYGQPIIEDIMMNSVMMQLAKYEEMSASEKEFDVFAGGLGAYWVGEGERIKTSAPKWIPVKMVAKKLGVIIPVSREYLQYKMPDFWEVMKPKIAEAFYKAFDAATILGTDNPYDWSVEKSAKARAVSGDITIANYDSLIGKLNDEDYEPNALISRVSNTTALKGLARKQGSISTPLFDGSAVDGVPVFNVHRDLSEMKKGTLYAGNFNYAYYGIPYGINYLFSQEAQLSTINASDGKPLNLFEEEMVAMRATMDVAFMILKDEAFAVLKPAAVGP